ncbi:ABC transporter substrate-binding protein [Streptomyces vilmorinianum]|uniref:ABC transporter substrate-binding protein n=1 Tax=Streptomyces vilmorinianum TaxID=3051092 RepID=UPI0010FB5276|nr:extracellular solute-binding protein [Streptomyces vilmorinianum]
MSTLTPRAGGPGPRRIRRRLTGTALAGALLAATATGCGAAVDGTGGQGSGSGQGVITLSMQNPNIKDQDPATYALVEAFNARNPQLRINLVGQPVEQHQQQMTIAAQSDTLPEVFWVYDSLARNMVKDGKLLDLTPILEQKGLGQKFKPSMVDGFRQGQVQYGVPYQALVTGFYYNKQILDRHGVPMPRTFDDLLAASKKLKAAGIVPIAKGANSSAFSVWSFLTMLSRHGFEEKTPAILDGTLGYDNPDFLRLYEHIAELADAGAFPSNVSTQTYAQAVASFTAGKAAFLDSGVWEAAKIQKSPVGPHTGFWAGPEFPDGVGDQRLAMNAPSAPFVVSAKVKKDDRKYRAVEAFLHFYYSDEGQQILVDNAQPPVTTYRPKVNTARDTVFAAVLDEAGRPGWSSPSVQPDLAVSAATASAMYDSLYGVIQKALTPKEAVELVQRSIT